MLRDVSWRLCDSSSCACHLDCFLAEAEKSSVDAAEAEVLEQFVGRVSEGRHRVEAVVH